jgi:hypothetical protein
MGALHPKHPGPAVGLEVDAGGDALAQQERKHVIAMKALGRGRVDLDPVAQAEQSLGARALPDHRIERGEQRLAGGSAGAACACVKECRLAPALDADGQKYALLDQLLHPRPGVLRLQPEIVA